MSGGTGELQTLLTKSPWHASVIAAGLLRRLHTWRNTNSYVWSVQVTALRERREDDEPRFNVVVVSATFAALEGLVEVPVMVNLSERETWPAADEIVRMQLHALEHLRNSSPQRRVVSFGAVSPGNRWRLHSRGWQYAQLMPPADSPLPLYFVEAGKRPIHLNALRQRLSEMRMTGGQEFLGWISLGTEVPDWPEGVYAFVHRDREVDIRVTNMNPHDPAFDPLMMVALGQSYVGGHLDFLGAGMYRGPSQAALLRHIALVVATASFIVERLARGCAWALERHQLAAQRYMDRYLREVPAAGRPLSEGEEEHARQVLADGEDFDFS